MAISDKIFCTYIWVYFILMCLAMVCVYMAYPNHFIENLRTLLEILLVYYWVSKVLVNKKRLSWAKFCGILLIVFWIFESIYLHDIFQMMDITSMLRSVFLSVFSAIGIYEILSLENLNRRYLPNNYYFFIGIFISNALTGIFYLFRSSIIYQSPNLACSLESVNLMMLISGLFVFAWGFDRVQRKKTI